MQEGLLPLFPLQVVLFPRTPLPLHIFEDRYKEMINEAVRDHSEFGVVLATDKGIVNTGCTAVVERVLKQYPDGRMDILCVGRRRFELLRLDDERSFLRGAVQFFDDEDFESTEAGARQKAIEGYNELQRLTPSPALLEPELSDPQLSFQLAQPLPELDFRQTLLATRSEAERMRQLAEYLPGYLARQRKIAHVKEIAPRNGHGWGNIE